jgi:hypothetical protein
MWYFFYLTIPGLYNDLREADFKGPCLSTIQMRNCQLPKYTLQNTKMYNITSYQSIH